MSQALSEGFSFRRSLAYPGWTMVFVSFVCIAFAFSASTSTMPLLYGAVIEEFGWSRTQATLIFSYKHVASAIVTLFFIGPLCRKVGLRRVAIGSFVITALAMTSFLWIRTLWGYYAAGVALGVGVAATFVSAKALVSRWFTANQGLALGVVLAGTSVGGVIAPLAYDRLEQSLGWRAAFAMLSLGIWAVALPLYLLKARENPSSADVLAENDHIDPGATLQHEPLGAAERRFSHIVRGRMFWWLLLSLLLIASADAGLMQHTALFLERDAGLSSTAAASALSATLGVGIIAKAAAGWFYDRYSIRGVSLWYLLLAGSLFVALLVHGPVTLALFATVRGISHGGLMTEPALVAKHCYGPRFLDMTIPVFIGVWSIGASLGPLLLALLYDAQGSYQNGFFLLIGASLLAAIALQRVEPRYHRAREPVSG